jgi:hypothetical protein
MEESTSGISNVNVVPRGNNVLVRMDIEASVMGITSGKYGNESGIPIITIAGIGPNVRDLAIGDKVLMKLQEYESVPVAGNNKDIASLKKFYATLKPSELSQIIKETPKVSVVQYGLFAEFLILAKVK